MVPVFGSSGIGLGIEVVMKGSGRNKVTSAVQVSATEVTFTFAQNVNFDSIDPSFFFIGPTGDSTLYSGASAKDATANSVTIDYERFIFDAEAFTITEESGIVSEGKAFTFPLTGSVTPITLIPSAGLLLDIDADNITGLENEDPISSVPAGPNTSIAASQSGTARPLYLADGINGHPGMQYDATNDVLDLSGSVAFTGAFTVYAVGTRAESSRWVPLGRNATGTVLMIDSDNAAYLANDAHSFGAAAANVADVIVVRFRRTAANDLYVAANGLPEAHAGTLSGTFTFSRMGARPFFSQWSGNGNTHARTSAYGRDVTPDSDDDLIVRGLIEHRYGLTL